MNKITTTIIQYIEKYLETKKEPVEGNNFNRTSLYMDFFPLLIEDFKNGDELTSESVFTIFELLSVEPTRSYQNIENNLRFIDSQEEEVTFKSKEELNEKALFHILDFINLSIYILKQKEKDEQKEFKTLLLVMSIYIYENLYSSRGKMKFAYYFSKLLDHHDKPYTLITAYKSSSWRGEYGDYAKEVKEYIDELPLSSHDDRMDKIYINNIVIIIGQMKDERLADKEMQYFIQMATFNIPTQDFQPLFSTNFK